jgi:hypothetical protein
VHEGRQGRQGRAARAGPGRARSSWAGLGLVAGQNPMAHTTTDWKSNRESTSETRRGKHAIKHDIRQKKYASA